MAQRTGAERFLAASRKAASAGVVPALAVLWALAAHGTAVYLDRKRMAPKLACGANGWDDASAAGDITSLCGENRNYTMMRGIQ